MALPQDWSHIDWRQSVIVLPEITEGIASLPLNADQFPKYGRAYYMMAVRQDEKPVVYYNAKEVGTGGQFVSQFVFWHEIGHFKLGHVHASLKDGDHSDGPGVFDAKTTGNKEVDADLFAYRHWMNTKTLYGAKVIDATVTYLQDLAKNGDQGDKDHPSPSQRAQLLASSLKSHTSYVRLHNDNNTPGEYVLGFLVGAFKMTKESATSAMKEAEKKGWVDIWSATGFGFGMGFFEAYERVKFISEDAPKKGHKSLRIEVKLL